MLGLCVGAAAAPSSASEPFSFSRFQLYLADRSFEAGTLCVLLNISWYAYHGEDQNNLYMAAARSGPSRIRQCVCESKAGKLLKAGSKYILLAILLLLARGRILTAFLCPKLLFGSYRAAPEAASRCHFTGGMSCRKHVAALSAKHTVWMSFQVDAVAEASWHHCILPAFRLRWLNLLVRCLSSTFARVWMGSACVIACLQVFLPWPVVWPKRTAACHVSAWYPRSVHEVWGEFAQSRTYTTDPWPHPKLCKVWKHAAQPLSSAS